MAGAIATVYYDSNYNFYVTDGITWYKIDNNDLQYCVDSSDPNQPVDIAMSKINFDLAQEIDDTDLPELTILTCGSEIYNQIKEGIYYFSNESQSGGVVLL